MKLLFTTVAAVAALAIVSTHAEEAISADEIVEKLTWEEFMHDQLYILMSDCEEMDERQDENIPWTCDRFYLHEDAYPALQVHIFMHSTTHNTHTHIYFSYVLYRYTYVYTHSTHTCIY